MKRFTSGTMRSAMDGARLSAAHDLVRRTLARHGLGPHSASTAAEEGRAMPSLDRMTACFAGPKGTVPTPGQTSPKGAEFSDDTFTCQVGSRTYRTYVPASATEGVTGVIMMLHGCTQTPEDFAAGTNMNALAERHGFVVVYPAQSRGDNAQSCWNWFSRGDQQRGRGEPAILAGIATKVCAERGVGRDRTFVAGLSAGAAMAVILGETYGDVFAAVGAHSGLPAGAANDVPSAFAAMGGNALDPASPLRSAHPTRTIIFHGTSDATVHASNSEAIARRALAAGWPQSVETTTQGQATGRGYTRITSRDHEGRSVVEHWSIHGQGHAWSGGHRAGSYTDPEGPDASAEMIRFFNDAADRKL